MILLSFAQCPARYVPPAHKTKNVAKTQCLFNQKPTRREPRWGAIMRGDAESTKPTYAETRRNLRDHGDSTQSGDGVFGVGRDERGQRTRKTPNWTRRGAGVARDGTRRLQSTKNEAKRRHGAELRLNAPDAT